MNIVQIGYYCLVAGAFITISIVVSSFWKAQREAEAREDEYMRSILTPEQYENYLLRKEIRKAATAFPAPLIHPILGNCEVI